jgi:hypothetical protein
MKKTKNENVEISEILGKELGIRFTNTEFKLDQWGDADNFCALNENDLVLLECEHGQKHPNTNVVKLFPYLERHTSKRIVLIHYFFPENKAPKNRLALCDFIASKMESSLNGRFQYISIKCSSKEIKVKLREQQKGLMQVLLTGKKRLNYDSSDFYDSNENN